MDKQLQERFWRSFSQSPFIMMRLDGSDALAEPMTAHLDKDAHHAIWFFAARDNRIGKGGKAFGHIASKGHEVFASLEGTLNEETDRQVREKHWDNNVEAWFPGGCDDDGVVMLRFDIKKSEVWTAEPTETGKMKLRKGEPIQPEEAGEHAVGTV